MNLLGAGHSSVEELCCEQEVPWKVFNIVKLYGKDDILRQNLCKMMVFLQWKLPVTQFLLLLKKNSKCGKGVQTSNILPHYCLPFPLPEDSPRSFWWYHLICWLLSAVGVVCILVAHEHYSVDVVVAYFITSRLFWWYHTMANLQVRAQSCPVLL